MPSSESSPVGALSPIPLNMVGDTTDISVPPDTALAELMPAIIKALRPLDPRTTTRSFTIRVPDGRVLNQSESFPDQRIHPGVALIMESSGTNVKDQHYDDLVKIVGTVVVENSVPWEKTSSIQPSAHVSTALVLLAALLLVMGSREPILIATADACGAILTILAAAVVTCVPNRPGALPLGHTIPVLISCAAFAVTPGHWFSLPLTVAGIGLLASLAILLILSSDLQASMTAPMTVGVSFIFVDGLVGMMDIPPDRTTATTLTPLVVTTFSVPWVAMVQLPMTIGTNRESERIDPVRVYSRIENARVLVISLRAGCSAVVVVLALLIAISPTAITMLACVGLALILTTRLLRPLVEVIIGMLTGMFLTVVAAITTTTIIPNTLSWTLSVTILAAVLLLATNVAPQKLRPWLTRLADTAEVLMLLRILPLAAPV